MPSTDHHTRHDRIFEANRFVYPVISRRASGLSIGVNLNPDKICNFGCIYCQVDRTLPGETRFVELPQLLDELRTALQMVSNGQLFELPQFRDVPQPLRRLNDIAFSGDGEPTTHKNLDQVVEACARVRAELAPPETKMVLITNASMFHRPHVQRALEILDANQGEIWAKLDAGTPEYYQLVDRSPISFERILENIRQAAQIRPIVIQTLFMRIRERAPSRAELAAYCQRLLEIRAAGGKISLIQIHTIARKPAEAYVSALADTEVDEIANHVEQQTGIRVLPYYGWSTSKTRGAEETDQ